MTSLLAYLGPPVRLSDLLVDPPRSPFRPEMPAEGRECADGFGVGWYVPELSADPAVFRAPRSPRHEANLHDLARVSCSPCVVAHVRAASPGPPVSEGNGHPFRHGRMLFAQSGRVGGFDRVRRAFLESLSDEAFSAVAGTTDSALVFGLFLDLLWAREEVEAHLRLAGALNETTWKIVATLQDKAPGAGLRLNVVMSDGEHLVASRFSWNEERLPDPLYYVDRHIFETAHPTPPARRARERSVVTTVSSEPLIDAADWIEIVPGHLIIADREVKPASFQMRPRGLIPAAR